MIISEIAKSSGAAFGTSGVRGLVTSLTPEVVFAYTTAFLQHLKQVHHWDPAVPIAVAGDLRPSTPQIIKTVVFAVEQMGGRVVNCGFIPTPALSYYAFQNKYPSVMVTGSHIPFDRNGIKFNLAESEISKADEQGILSQEVPIPASFPIQSIPPLERSAAQMYTDRYLNWYPEGALKGLKVGFYQHSAVGRDLLSEILSKLGAEIVPIGRSEEFVPVDTEAVSEEDKAKALSWTKEFGLDALISTDGDSDRPMIANERGVWFRGDALGILTAKLLGAKGVVTPVSSSSALEVVLPDAQSARTKIGSPFVIAGMEELEVDQVAGFEANGGFLVGTKFSRQGKVLEPLPTRDALLPITEVLAQGQKHVSALSADMPARYTESDRLQEIPTASSWSLIGELASGTGSKYDKFVAEFGEIAKVNETDGFRVYLESGSIVHFRPSGNAPELRCYTEASSLELAKELLTQGLRFLQSEV